MTCYYGSLSTDGGWVKAPLKLADNLLADFYSTDYSQSYLFLGDISSMAYLVSTYQENFDECVLRVRDELQKYFGRYFANVVVTVENVTKESSAFNEMEIYLSFMDKDEYSKKGEQSQLFTLKNVLDINAGKFEVIRKLST